MVQDIQILDKRIAALQERKKLSMQVLNRIRGGPSTFIPTVGAATSDPSHFQSKKGRKRQKATMRKLRMRKKKEAMKRKLMPRIDLIRMHLWMMLSCIILLMFLFLLICFC